MPARTFIKFFFALFLSTISVTAFAQTFTVPTTSTTGSFVVSVSDAYSWWVEEQVGSSWVSRGSGNYSGSISFTRTNGVYTFRLYNCFPMSGGCGYSSSKSIMVSISGSGGGGTVTVPPVGGTPAAPPTDSGSATPVGSMTGNFSVNESGSAIYDMPIAVAEGVAGVTPKISVTYDSQGGNGLVGIGANISGIGAISRCRQTKVSDGAAKPISWSGDDRFCLNGQRLMLVSSGSYGAPGTEYKTEVDQFVKVTAVGGSLGNPEYFTLESKDGSTTYFGFDSELNNSSRVTASSGHYVSWMQSVFKDNMQNRIQYVYEGDNTSGKRLKHIYYAYPSFSAGNHRARVELFYESRNDYSTSYMVGGTSFRATQRLKFIRSYNNPNGTEQLLRKYEFGYTSSTAGLSRLSTATECSGETSSTCYPSTSFTWATALGGFESTVNWISLLDIGKKFKSHKFLDIDGDGRQEVAWVRADGTNRYIEYATLDANNNWVKKTFTNGSESIVYYGINAVSQISYGTNTYTSINTEMRIEALDYNADGRQDLAICNPSMSDSDVCVSWDIVISKPLPSGGWWLSHLKTPMPFTEKNIQFGDVDSDGVLDAFIFNQSSVSFYPLVRKADPAYISTDNYYQFGSRKTISFSTAGFSFTQSACYLSSQYAPNAATLGDFNGDGVADVAIPFYYIDREQSSCMYYPASGYYDRSFSYTLIFLGNGSSFNYSSSFSMYHGTNLGSPVVAAKSTPDINGDGLSDVILNEGSKWTFRLNQGNGFSTPVAIATTAPNYSGDPNRYAIPGVIVADTNGDGFGDLYWHDKKNQLLKFRQWNPATSTFGMENIYGGTTKAEKSDFNFADVSGDGFADLVEQGDNGLGISYGKNSSRHNKIYNIVDGNGVSKTIEFGSVANSPNYTAIAGYHASWVTNPCPISIPYCDNSQVYYSNVADFYTQINNPFPNNTDANSASPILEIRGPLYVVTKVSSSNPIPGNAFNLASMSYYYHEARIQAGGRGFLGFKKFIVRDDQTGITTETEYEQGWPFTGVPRETKVKSKEGSVLSGSTTIWAKETDTANNRIRRIYADITQEKSYGLKNDGAVQGTLLQTINTYTDYDTEGYGNVTRLEVTATGSTNTSTKTTVNEYGTSSWEKRMGRLKRATVTNQRNSEAAVIRVSDFEYYPDGDFRKGLLWKEIVEPGANAFTTLYDYDSNGNKILVQKTALVKPGVSQTRKTTTEYETNRRYVKEVKDGLGNIISGVTARDAIYGSPTFIRDINNVVTEIIYNDIDGTEKQRKDATGAWVHTKRWFCDATQCPGMPLAKFKVEKWISGGGRTIEYFDMLGRTIRTSTLMFDGTFSHVDTEYNTRGLVARKSEPYTGPATYWTVINNYDILGTATQTTMPNGAVVNTVIDGYKITTSTTANNITLGSTEEKNSLGNLVKVTDQLGGTVNYGYDVLGNLTSVTTKTADSSKQVVIRMCYDKYSRKIAMHDPDKGGFLGNANATCDQVDDYLTSPAANKLTGWWYYNYNDFGELIEQTDTKKQVTSMDYDQLGRMINRTDRFANGSVDAHTTWYYDRPYGTSGTYTNYQGKLAAVVTSYGVVSGLCSGSNHCQTYTLDSAARVTDTVTYLPNNSTGYISSVKYDTIGRVDEVRDVLSGLIGGALSGTKTMYNANGYVGEIRDLASGDIIQKTVATNARGQITQEKRFNGAAGDVVNDYFADTGLIKSTKSSIGGALLAVQDVTYDWDAFGNLKSRWNQSSNIGRTAKKNLQESFCYDGLNRLIKSHQGTLAGSCSMSGSAQDQEYDGLGNITRKTGVGNYTYGSNAGPHAVTATTTDGTYTYDNNGNQVSSINTSGSVVRSISYSSYDQPTLISKGTTSTQFKYDANRARYERVDIKNSVTTLTQYLGNVERIERTGSGVVEWKRYVAGAIYTLRTTATNCGGSTCYALQRTEKSAIYNDHLGSLDVVVNSSGTITNTASSEAWGSRRNGETWGAFIASSLSLTGFDQPITTRGFTSHEMVDDMGLIHMNGRIYDPRLARFMQADPNIDGVTNTQGYNRYSYVQNNPLNATDPTGYLSLKFLKQAMGIIVGTMMTIACYGTCGPWAYAMIGAFSGAAQAIANGGNVEKAIFTGAVTAMAFYAVGAHFRNLSNTNQAVNFSNGLKDTANLVKFGGNYLTKMQVVMQVTAHAVVGGASAKMSGGEFRHGALSAGFTKAVTGSGATEFGSGTTATVSETFAAAVLGGTVSEITGGKFANGAQTAAFAYLFNQGLGKLPKVSFSFGEGTERVKEVWKQYKNRILSDLKSDGYALKNTSLRIELGTNETGSMKFIGDKILVNPALLNVDNYSNGDIAAAIGHELVHVYDYQNGLIDFKQKISSFPRRAQSEIRAYEWNIKHNGTYSPDRPELVDWYQKQIDLNRPCAEGRCQL